MGDATYCEKCEERMTTLVCGGCHDRVKNERDEAREDSERLDWLERLKGTACNVHMDTQTGTVAFWRVEYPPLDKPGAHGDTLREAIDAAREK